MTSMDERHRREVANAYRSARLLRTVSYAVNVVGVLSFAWAVGAVVLDEIAVAEGILAAAAVALGTAAAGAGLFAASYRTSIGAANLERKLARE